MGVRIQRMGCGGLPAYRRHPHFRGERPGPPGSACAEVQPAAWTVGRGGLLGFGNLEGSCVPRPKALDQAPVGAVSCGGGGRGSEAPAWGRAVCGLQPSALHREMCTYVLLYPGWSRSWQMAAVIRTRMSIWENFSWVGEGEGW